MKREIKGWRDVTLEEFVAINDVLQGDGTDEEKVFGIMQIFHGEGVKDWLIEEYKEKTKELSFLNEKMPFNWWVKKHVKIGGEIYEIVKGYEELTTAQFFDLQNVLRGGSTIERYGKILSLCLVPKGKKYGEGYDVAEVEKAVQGMSVVDAFEIVRFFFRHLKKLFKRLKYFLLALTITSKRRQAKELRDRLRDMEYYLTSLEWLKLQTKLLRL